MGQRGASPRRLCEVSKRRGSSSEREQDPHRDLQRRIEAVAPDVRVAVLVGNQEIRPAVARRYPEVAKLTLDPDFLHDVVVVTDDRDLGLRIEIAGEIRWRRWCRVDLGRRWRGRWRRGLRT